MERRILMAVVAAAVLLPAGCARSAQPPATLPPVTASVAASATAAAARPSQDPGLASELITVHDLPAGWTDLAVPNTHASSYSCDALNLGAPTSHALSKQAAAAFQELQDTFVLNEVLESGSAAQVSTVWSRFADAGSACPTFTITSSSGSIAYKLTALSFPSVGAPTQAFAMTATKDGITAAGEIVEARKGDLLVVIIAAGVEHTIPESVVQRAMTTAVARA